MKYNPSTDKRKGGLSNLGAHIDRHHLSENVDQRRVGLNESIEVNQGDNAQLIDILGQEIDSTKTHLNRDHNEKKSRNLELDIEKRIKEGHTVLKNGKLEAIRYDAVRALFLILTGSHEQMLKIYDDKARFKTWKKANEDFVSDVFGKENMVRFEVHLDEMTPHIHCVVVPISKEGRLSARSFVNGSKTLRNMQDLYATRMAPFDLERGIPNDISYRTQRSGLEYNPEVNKIVEKAKEMTSDINLLKVHKLGDVREKVTDQVTQLGVRVEKLERQNKYLSTSNKTLMDGTKKRIYDQSFKEVMDEKLDWIKRNVEIGPFLKEKGWKIDKLKSSRRDEVLSHPRSGEKVIVPVNPKSNGHRIFSYPGGGGGTLIDILRKEDWEMEEILKLSHAIPLHHVQKDDVSKQTATTKIEVDPEEARKKAQKHIDSILRANAEGFLEKRKIEKRLYTSFKDVKVGREAAVFSLYKNFDKDGKADLCSTITYKEDQDGNKGKYFQQGLSRGMSLLVDADSELKEVKRIVVTESPVDALSYKQLELTGRLHAENREEMGRTAYLSTCGSLGAQIRDDLRIVFEMAAENGQKVVLGFDNDLAGKKMTETLVHIAQESGCEYHIETPAIGKDWNDQLCDKNVDTTHNIPQSLAQSRWKIFEKTGYEHSLFEKLSFERETFNAFKGTLKTGEREMVVALKPIGGQEISATWHLELNSNKKFKEILEDAPLLSVLKGNTKEASELVLVISPIDALVHYQSVKDDGICYVQVNIEEKGKLERPLLELVEQENWNQVIVANGLKNEAKANVVAQFLEKEKKKVERTSLDVSAIVTRSAGKLGIEKDTIEAFKDKSVPDLEVKQEEKVIFSEDKEEKQGKKASPLLVIKGDMKEAEKVVLVASTEEAMLHYEAQMKKGGEEKRTCYVLADLTDKDELKASIENLKKYAAKRAIYLSIAAGKGNMYAARRIKYSFKEESMRVYNERLKREVPLSGFLQEELGWKKDNQRSSENNDVLISPRNGEKIVVPTEPKKNGHRVFSYDGGREGGTIIDLLVEEKWQWKDIAKLAESKFLPKIEEIKEPKIIQKEESVPSRDEGINVSDSQSMASILGEGLGLLSALMSAGLNANRQGGRDAHEEEEEEKELEKKRRAMGVRI